MQCGVKCGLGRLSTCERVKREVRGLNLGGDVGGDAQVREVGGEAVGEVDAGGGEAAAEDGLASGEAVITTAKPQVDGGNVRALAIMTTARSPVLPNLATTREQGLDVQA